MALSANQNGGSAARIHLYIYYNIPCFYKNRFFKPLKTCGVYLDVNAIRYLFDQICVVDNSYLPMWLNVDCDRRCLDQVEVN